MACRRLHDPIPTTPPTPSFAIRVVRARQDSDPAGPSIDDLADVFARPDVPAAGDDPARRHAPSRARIALLWNGTSRDWLAGERSWRCVVSDGSAPPPDRRDG